MRLDVFLGGKHVNGVVGELMHEGDQHLIGVEVAVQRDAADAVAVLRRTEIAQFGVSRLLELQLETRVFIRFNHHGHGRGRKIALQNMKFFLFHAAKIETTTHF